MATSPPSRSFGANMMMLRKSHQPLDQDQLAAKLETLEEQWRKEGLLLAKRPLESFQEIYGSVLDEEGREELFGPITLWYIDKYGMEAMKWDGIIARFPVLLRGLPYLVQIPFSRETTMIKLTDRFEKLPPEVTDTLTPEEFERIGGLSTGATMSWQSITELSADNTFLSKPNRELLRRALSDIDAACCGLVHTGDTQRVIFDAHAAAEKF